MHKTIFYLEKNLCKQGLCTPQQIRLVYLTIRKHSNISYITEYKSLDRRQNSPIIHRVQTKEYLTVE